MLDLDEPAGAGPGTVCICGERQPTGGIMKKSVMGSGYVQPVTCACVARGSLMRSGAGVGARR